VAYLDVWSVYLLSLTCKSLHYLSHELNEVEEKFKSTEERKGRDESGDSFSRRLRSILYNDLDPIRRNGERYFCLDQNDYTDRNEDFKSRHYAVAATGSKWGGGGHWLSVPFNSHGFYNFSGALDFVTQDNLNLIENATTKKECKRIESHQTEWLDYTTTYNFFLPPDIKAWFSWGSKKLPRGLGKITRAALANDEALLLFTFQDYPYWCNGNGEDFFGIH